MEVLRGLLHLQVIIGVEAQPGFCRLMGKHQSNFKSTNYCHIKILGTWSMDLFYLRRQRIRYRGWHITSHSRFSFFTSVNIGTGVTQKIREGLFGQKPKKTLVLVCIKGLKKGHSSILGLHTTVF